METPSLRVRLEFGDRSILSKPQRSDGMNKSWLLLKLQQHRTISDVCTHLLHIFKLHRSCPNGILLSMDGFVLPPSESTEILKDKELICVKKKGGATPDADNLLDEVEADDLEPGENGLLLLANDKGTEEVQSESEEVDEEQSQDEEDEEPVSKKRKASIKLQNSNRNKRPCLRVLDDVENEAETQEFDNDKKAEQAKQVSAPGGKKMPSRSARRKKAKRQWMQELAKISKKKPQPYSKPVVTPAENKDSNGRPKGLLHWKQASKKHVHKNRVEEASNQNGDVAVVTRPGHIRFENLDEDEAAKQTDVSNEAFRWNGSSNGKKKGQRWGSNGKFSTSRRNDTKRIDKKSFKMSITDMQVPIIDPSDFSKLPPCCSPQEGDVIAYRLLELSSSWIPEFSSFRVGRISYYDARDIVLIPVPEYPIVTDKTDENRPNDSLYGEDGTLEINYSALLDVCYVKQYDPEAAKDKDKEAVTKQAPVTVTVTVTDGKDAAENLVSNSNDNNTNNVSKDSNTGGEANPWDHFSKANSNTETPLPLPDVNHSSMVVSGDPGPNADIAENRDKGKGSMGNPWLNADKPDASQENQSSLTGWTSGKKVDCGEGSSWGRPWSSFTPLRGSSVNVQSRGNDWGGRGSSRGNGNVNVRPWGPRGRGGRGRGRGRNA
ncbi:coilin isoform X1 [Lactuca sativa]|uniref:Coilin n=1 Tax=Lactuca sativa TaxID=4236 RepID=A0A9R1W250_LACSA|nr:coilin isoform X1 [Lactuca sativa]XP_042756006.1 coilin isoform X1 [Lactuca sativa]XP_042756007.1 coilin isoform X1 [Lactuca sativa]XP_042756008.1 coilin isoform X1 [Lactuca sativa]KAJ0215142.1 hypothetical protein LSAT_V11C300112850 [Lactuca sativa]